MVKHLSHRLDDLNQNPHMKDRCNKMDVCNALTPVRRREVATLSYDAVSNNLKLLYHVLRFLLKMMVRPQIQYCSSNSNMKPYLVDTI